MAEESVDNKVVPMVATVSQEETDDAKVEKSAPEQAAKENAVDAPETVKVPEAEKAKAKPAPKAKAAKKPAKKAKASPKAKASAAPKNPASKPQKKAAAGNVFFEKFTNPNAMEATMTQGKEQLEKATQEAADMARANAEAWVKSGTIFMKGYEEMLRVASEMSQKAAEKQTKFVQDAMSSKTLNELTTLQNQMAQTNFDDFMAGATKLSEMGAKVLTESAEPVNAQLSKTVEKATKAMAA